MTPLGLLTYLCAAAGGLLVMGLAGIAVLLLYRMAVPRGPQRGGRP